MTPDELITLIDSAYAEPGRFLEGSTSQIAHALFLLVRETYDEEATAAEQAAALFMGLWRVKERLERVLNAVDQAGRNTYQ